MHNSSPNSMFDHLLESSHRDDSNKWSNIGFGEEITQVELIEVKFYAPYLVLWIPSNTVLQLSKSYTFKPIFTIILLFLHSIL